MRVLAGFLAVLIVVVNCAAQTTRPKKPVQKPRSPAPSSFTCPDSEAQQACKSYEELLKAKDTGLPTDTAYICFRKNEDEFFLVSFSKPHFQRRWDPDLKQVVIDTAETYPGSGFVRSYKDGVEDSTITPSLFFSGKWYAYSESGLFAADTINLTKQDDKDPDNGVSIDESQLKDRRQISEQARQTCYVQFDNPALNGAIL